MSKEGLQVPFKEKENERKRKGAPVHIIYGSHGPEDAANLNYLDRVIDSSLKSVKGDVVVFLEGADITDSDVGLFNKRMKEEGLSLTECMVHELYERNFKKSLFKNSKEYVFAHLAYRMSDPFLARETEIIDRYRDAGRIRLLFESKSDIKEGQKADYCDLDMDIDESLKNVYVGNFKKGLCQVSLFLDSYSHFL